MLPMQFTRSLIPGILTLGIVMAQPVPQSADEMGNSPDMPRCYLGIGFQDIDPERSKALNLQPQSGIEVTMVAENSPAMKAGLKIGDIILSYNGAPVKGMDSFSRFVYDTPINREIKLGVQRDSSQQEIALVTGARVLIVKKVFPQIRTVPNPTRARQATHDTPRATMSWRSGMLGIEAESLMGGLAEYFGVKEGVLVRAVGEDTAAEKAGLKAGDVIVKVDGIKVSSARQITGILRAHDRGTFKVSVMREKHPLTLSIQLDEAAESPAMPARSVKQ